MTPRAGGMKRSVSILTRESQSMTQKEKDTLKEEAETKSESEGKSKRVSE